MASRLGCAVAPFLVYPLLNTLGWRTPFYLFAIIGIGWAIVWHWWYRDQPSRAGHSLTEESGDGSGTINSGHDSLNWNALVRDKNFWMLILMWHTYCWGAYFYFSWLHTYLEKQHGFADAQLQWFSAFPFLLGAAANFFGGWLSDLLFRRYGVTIARRAVGVTALILSSLFLMATAFASNHLIAVICLTLGFGCMDCMVPIAWAICLDLGHGSSGAISGAMNTAGQVGSFISAVVFGYLVHWYGDYNRPLIPLAIMVLISAGLFMCIDPTKSFRSEVLSSQPTVIPLAEAVEA